MNESLGLVSKTLRGKVYRWRPGSNEIAIWYSLSDATRLIPDEVISLPEWMMAEKVSPELFELVVWMYAETHD